MTYASIHQEEFTPEIVGDLLGSLAYVRAHHSYGQHMSSSLLSPEDFADPKKVEEVLATQLKHFLQSQGVSTRSMSDDDLKEYLTGEPVWFVSRDRVLRVPKMGISQRSAGFKVRFSTEIHVDQKCSDILFLGTTGQGTGACSCFASPKQAGDFDPMDLKPNP